MAATTCAGSMSVEDKQAIEQHKALLLGVAENIQEQLDKLTQLGHYYGAFDTYNQADATHTSLATDNGSPTPNDFAHIKADETHEGAKPGMSGRTWETVPMPKYLMSSSTRMTAISLPTRYRNRRLPMVR